MGESAWEIVTFTLNAILFTLIGLHLPSILDALDAYSAGDLIGGRSRSGSPSSSEGALGLPGREAATPARPEDPRARPDAPALGAGAESLVRDARRGVAGRGPGDPAEHDSGEPFPGRDLILFLTFAVIFGTLVDPGPDAAGRDSPQARGRRRSGAGRGAGAYRRRTPRSSDSRSWSTRSGCGRTRPSGSAAATIPRAASCPGSTAATTARSRPARATSSGCGGAAERGAGGRRMSAPQR